MREIKIYQIDAFAQKVFEGNPAAVCPLDRWLPDDELQHIAEENKLAETAFFVPTDFGFHIRWFTPRCEVPLCGHATLATAFVIFTEIEPGRRSVEFESGSGPLSVRRNNDLLELDFPSFEMKPIERVPENLLNALDCRPKAVLVVDDDPNYYVVLADEAAVAAVEPDMGLLETLHPYGVVVTAPGVHADIVSRCFAPSYDIPEDPVTGSIHCALVPYWSKRLNKKKIHAFQASSRGGHLYCEEKDGRVLIRGHAVKYLSGKITI